MSTIWYGNRVPSRAGVMFEIYAGDVEGEHVLIGTVGQVLGTNNRPTGQWSYEMADEKKTMNWRAGRTSQEAGQKLYNKWFKAMKSKQSKPDADSTDIQLRNEIHELVRDFDNVTPA